MEELSRPLTYYAYILFWDDSHDCNTWWNIQYYLEIGITSIEADDYLFVYKAKGLRESQHHIKLLHPTCLTTSPAPLLVTRTLLFKVSKLQV